MTRTALAPLVVLLLAASPTRAQEANPAIRDNGNFFSNQAEQKAAGTINEIAGKHPGKQVLIETYNEVPDGQAVREFAVKRAQAAGLKGVYVIVVRKGGQVGVFPDSATGKLLTPEVVNRLDEQFTTGLKKGTQNFDAALIETVASLQSALDRATAAAAVSATTAPAAGSTARPLARSRVDQIFDALGSEVPELRRAAADVLRASAGDRGTAEAAAPRLLAMLQGSDAAARVLAADLLGELAKGNAEWIKPAVPPLVAGLRDNTSNDLRRVAARALGRAGPSARDAAAGPLRTAAENDADAGVRQEAAAALRAVGGSEKP